MTLTGDQIVKLERDSIAAFVLSCRNEIRGRVLDYGCGLQPYRDIVLDHIDMDGEYVPHDRKHYPANVSGADVGPDYPLADRGVWDTILCNQIIQYVEEPYELLVDFVCALKPDGYLILTGPTNWRELEAEDLYRFTLAGIRRMLDDAGFHVERAERRVEIEPAPGFPFSLGWGVLCQPR